MTKTWVVPVSLLAAVLLLAPTARAAAIAELFFSEYVEGSSNNKALEIFNGTGAAVDLAAGGYAVQMYFNGNTVAGLTIAVLGTLAPGDVFVLAHASATAAILLQADQLSGSTFFNGDDAIALVRGSAIVDVIGQIGLDPGTEWGAGLTSTADNTLRRRSTILGGDPDGTDPFAPAVEWEGFALDAVDGLGTHAVTVATAVPEPPSVLALAGALGALALARRTRLLAACHGLRHTARGPQFDDLSVRARLRAPLVPALCDPVPGRHLR
ncbi:MAG: lamin tail domain-containing protein [Candidatus Rokubacteria bacterium]|nr:lamin tail domain-containing protein [Candidatus Rokubacteria bacterium]